MLGIFCFFILAIIGLSCLDKKNFIESVNNSFDKPLPRLVGFRLMETSAILDEVLRSNLQIPILLDSSNPIRSILSLEAREEVNQSKF